MDYSLLVCKSVERTRFEKENFLGDDDILAIVESGSFWFDDGTGKTTVSPLEGVCFKKGKTYHREILKPVRMYMFRFRSDSSIFGAGKVTFQNTERIRSTLHLLHLVDQDVHMDDFSLKKSLFSDIVTQFRLENIHHTQLRTQEDPIIAAALEHIQANFHKKLNLAELAEKNYLSYIQFSRRFKDAMDMTPQNYVTNLRLKKAKVLLGDTNLPIKHVALTCGFSSEYYFSNFFKKCNGLSPSEFRAMHKSRI